MSLKAEQSLGVTFGAAFTRASQIIRTITISFIPRNVAF